jgi:hypothetical protein
MSPKWPFKRICGMPNKTTRQATRPKKLSGPVRSNSMFVVPGSSPTHRGRAEHHIGCRQSVFTRQLPSPIPTATLPLLFLGRSHPTKSPPLPPCNLAQVVDQPYRYADRASHVTSPSLPCSSSPCSATTSLARLARKVFGRRPMMPFFFLSHRRSVHWSSLFFLL